MIKIGLMWVIKFFKSGMFKCVRVRVLLGSPPSNNASQVPPSTHPQKARDAHAQKSKFWYEMGSCFIMMTHIVMMVILTGEKDTLICQ